MIAAAIAERQQVRKVRASQGRMPDNVRWRRLQGQCNRKETALQYRFAKWKPLAASAVSRSDVLTQREVEAACGFGSFAKRYCRVRVEWQCKRLPLQR